MVAQYFKPPPSKMGRAEFVARFGFVYEDSPWVADAAYETIISEEIDQLDGIAAQFRAVVDGTDETQILKLLCAHPILADRVRPLKELALASQNEQRRAGLDQCSEAEFAAFHDLNRQYQARFEFPFIIAVAGKGPAEILAIFRQRLGNTRAEEFATALDEVHKIAQIRLSALQKQE